MQKTLDISLAVIVAFGIGLSVTAKAKSAELTITRGIPTVSGIPQASAPHRAYQPKPTVNIRPRAGIQHLEQAAPDNGCPVPAFRVVSGPVAERGCYGALN